MAKKADAPYRAGRSPAWLKIRLGPDRRLRDRRLYRAERIAGGLRRAAPRRSVAERHADLRRAGSAAGSPASSSGCAPGSLPPGGRSARLHVGGRTCRPAGRPSTSLGGAAAGRARCASRSGPATDSCATRSSSACGTTKPASECVAPGCRRRRPSRIRRVRAAEAGSGPGSERSFRTSTRCSGRTRATPRAISSSITGPSRPGCCPTCATGPSC